MDSLDIAAFVVMGLLVAIGVGVIIFFGGWPGRVAKRLNHPYQEAISVGGWVTLIAGGVAWPFMLIWAYAIPKGDVKIEAKSDTQSEPVEQQTTAQKEL